MLRNNNQNSADEHVKKEKNSSSSTTRRSMVRGMGSLNRLMVANDRRSFRQFAQRHGTRGGWHYMTWRLRRHVEEDTSFRREIMDGIVGYRGNRTGGFYPDMDLYTIVKRHGWSSKRNKYQKEREVRDEYGATEREKRKARSVAKKNKKRDKRREPRRW